MGASAAGCRCARIRTSIALQRLSSNSLPQARHSCVAVVDVGVDDDGPGAGWIEARGCRGLFQELPPPHHDANVARPRRGCPVDEVQVLRVWRYVIPVSYTHLTLPTSDLV